MSRTKARRMSALWDLHTAFSAGDVEARGGIGACFSTRRPLVLEIGSGRGESLLAMATQDSRRNYAGIDLKSARLWSGARSALSLGLDNLLFVQAEARRLPELSGPGSVDELWIPFPDPVPRGSKAHKRLVSPHHLAAFGRVLRPGSRIHLKTDSDALFAYALAVVERTACPLHACVPDVHASPPPGYPAHALSTYERRYAALGRPIHYICFELGSGLTATQAGPIDRSDRQARLQASFGLTKVAASPVESDVLSAPPRAV